MNRIVASCAAAALVGWGIPRTAAHPSTRPHDETGRRLATAVAHREEPEAAIAAARIQVRIDDEFGRPAPALLRITAQREDAQVLPIPGGFERPAGWYATDGELAVPLAAGVYRVEAVRGIDTLVAAQEVKALVERTVAVRLAPRTISGWPRESWSVNTHLHLLLDARLKMGVDLAARAEAEEYLRVVAAADELDLVFLSYLMQPGQEIVSNEVTAADLESLSSDRTRFAPGIEHRHAGRRITVAPKASAPAAGGAVYTSDNSAPAMSYGHVLLLDVERQSIVASIGPGLSEAAGATDGVPLRDGMEAARAAGGAVLWSHGRQGLEWVPTWVAGLAEGQNIFDGGNEGAFEDVYYPLLNAGFAVPFSTGTDWGVWDFSRVQVPGPGEPTPEGFREHLRQGRTMITNEPHLEFSVEDLAVGATWSAHGPGAVRVKGRAVGRSDFVRLQVVQDGRVIAEAPCRPEGGHFEAEIETKVTVKTSGWLALRIPPVQPYFIRAQSRGAGTNIFGKTIFAHTSPVYVEIAGRSRVKREAVELLIGQVRAAWRRIDEVGVFATPAEREAVQRMYTDAESLLQRRLAASAR